MTDEPVRSFTGERGTKVEIRDLTRAYAYKNIHHVVLEVTASFSGTDEKFTRTLEKMGVFDEDLEITKKELMDAFEQNGLSYLMRPEFPIKLKAALEKNSGPKTGYGK